MQPALLQKSAPAGRSYLSCAAVLSEDGKTLTVFAINKNPDEAATLSLSGFEGAPVQHVTLTAPSFDTVNTAEAQPVLPHELPLAPDGAPELPPASWNMLRFRLA